ncbi:hypothetical protein EV141_1353 [Microcella putealis]|uniref:Uncharacterized protein n=1 Tax=Microcella putealis TaxID=337005 RepID=A0A4Q7LVA0_9MICO|nr:hypothetical protein [Microcella putealis]RZS57639.1 hypothetical protein EV141_1353 [Microcella putealis]TQM24706.1 hypothetical protein BJ957_0962 [Microcella putealis]HET8958742.1 hypothetical protein [Microcella sp.]
MSRTRIGVVVMAALLALYLVVVGLYAVRLVTDPLPVVQAMGWALILLPLLGAWALAAELRFGVQAERLATQLEAEGGLPDDELPASASGRLDRERADALFARYKAEVEADPEPWQNWFRLALAYDGARDRRRARWATREAIRRERDARA